MNWSSSTHSNRSILSKFALLLLSLTVLICAIIYRKDSLAKPQIDQSSHWQTINRDSLAKPQVDQSSRWQTINVASHIVRTKAPTWRWQEVKLPGQRTLIAVKFFDEKEGVIVSSEGSIFKTENAGETWIQNKVEIPEGTQVSSASYLSPKLAWLGLGASLFWKGEVLTSPIPLVLQTNDAGLNWSTQFTGEKQTYYQVQFVDEQEGWITGRGVFHTTDQGRHWVKVAIPNEGKYSFYHLYALGTMKAIVMTSEGWILSTEDGGKAWRQISSLERPSPGYDTITKLGSTANNNFWVITGADSKEGMWGELSHLESNLSWVKYQISEVNFSDVFYVTKNEVLACGSYMADSKDFGHLDKRDGDILRSVTGYWDKRAGVILRSLNGGRDWNFLYRNPKVRSINAFAVLSQDSIWAVGDNGFVVKLLSK